MSGFSAEWLALREPADHRARNPELLSQLQARFSSCEAVSVVDLGCGAGSNLRALAPVLPRQQSWRLVDYDAGLLAAARERLSDWADRSHGEGDELVLAKADRTLRIRFVQADLAADLEQVVDEPSDLVTAAALFDLVSEAWMERFAPVVAATGAAFYTALTYNGEESWKPAHPGDRAMAAAFHAHQGGDKGFGPSAGPAATAPLTKLFERVGYRVLTGDSPWRLERGDAELMRQLAAGVAQAVRETGRVPESAIVNWLQNRLQATSCTVGHTDLLALPPT
jgi:SAM-dependent methyltransferase